MASLAQLADLNVALTRNGATPELLDRRDAILADVAEQLDVAVTVGKQGTVTVYTSGGVALLDGGLRQLVYERAALVGPTTAFGAIRAFSADQLDPDRVSRCPVRSATCWSAAGSGRSCRRSSWPMPCRTAASGSSRLCAADGCRVSWKRATAVLPDLADELSELADMTRFTLNAAHNSANAYPPPSQLTGSNTDTGTFAAAARSGTAHLAVIDRTTGAVAATVDIDVGAPADAASLAAQIAAGLGGYGTAGLAADGHLEISATGDYALALERGRQLDHRHRRGRTRAGRRASRTSSASTTCSCSARAAPPICACATTWPPILGCSRGPCSTWTPGLRLWRGSAARGTIVARRRWPPLSRRRPPRSRAAACRQDRSADRPFDAMLVMQSAEDPDLRFLMLPCNGKAEPLLAADLEAACAVHGLASHQVAVLLVVSRQPAEEETGLGARLCANLRAPVLIDTTSGIAVQHVLDSPNYPLRYPLQQAA